MRRRLGSVTGRKDSLLRSIVACTSSTRPGSPAEGQVIYETDTDYHQVYDGSAWVPAGQSARSWTVISDTTRGSNGVFGSITVPQTFAHLKIILTGRGNTAVTLANARMQINGDTGANYDTQVLYVSNTTVAGGPAAGTTTLPVGGLPGTSAVANTAGLTEILLPDYRSTTFYKTVQAVSGHSSSTAADNYAEHRVGTWRNTAAITSFIIDYNAIGTGWLAGTRLTLLGIR